MPNLDTIQAGCREDPWYFATHWVKTEDPQAAEAVRAFPTYGYLQTFFKAVLNHRLIAVRKSRQLLFSWSACVIALWCAAFAPHRQVLIQSQKEDKAKHLVRRIAFIIKHLPDWLLPCDVHIKSSEIEFLFGGGNRSVIWCVPQGPDQVATYEPSLIILDEMALQNYARETYYSALPVLRGGGQLIGISSPRAETFFVTFCNKIPAVHVLDAHYKDHPDFKSQAEELGGWEAWKKIKIKEWGWEDENMWDREMEINEDVSGGIPAFRPPFRPEVHVADRPMIPNPAVVIQRGWDFGFQNPACVWTQLASNGQWLVLREHQGKDIPLTDFITDVEEKSKKLAPFPGRNTFQDFIDPDGYSKPKAHTGASCADLLYERKIYPLSSRKKVPLVGSVNIIRRNLRMLRLKNPTTGEMELRPGTLIDPSCTLIIRGLNGAYCAPEKGLGKEPKFTGGRTQDVIDALRYIAAGTFTLGADSAKGRDGERKYA